MLEARTTSAIATTARRSEVWCDSPTCSGSLRIGPFQMKRAGPWRPGPKRIAEEEASMRRRHLLFDLALQAGSRRGKLGDAGLHQPGIEPAIVLDGAQACARHAQPEGAAEHVRNERDVVQVGQELALGLAVGVADLVAGLNGLLGQRAAARHGRVLLENEGTPREAGPRPGRTTSGAMEKRSARIVAGPGRVKTSCLRRRLRLSGRGVHRS